LRKGAARRLWIASATVAGAMTIVFLIAAMASSSLTDGSVLFRWLFILGTGSAIYFGLQVTADLFSEERREGTLGLLYLTGMSTAEIFASKLLVATLTCAYSLLVAIPFFSITFLVGGVPLTDFICALASFANGLLFSLAMGALASVVSREGSQAFTMALALAASLCLATPAWSWAREHLAKTPPLDDRWHWLSPAAGPWMVYSRFRFGTPGNFVINSAVTFGYSLCALGIAGHILHRTWREDMMSPGLKSWMVRWQIWARGDADWRKRLQEDFMEENPIVWLAMRDRSAPMAARAFLIIVASAWMAGLSVWGKEWLQPAGFFVTALLLHVGLTGIVVHAAARCLGRERQGGGLELLLTTPLTAEQIVRGYWRALTRQFRGLLIALLGIDALFLVLGMSKGQPSVVAALSYVVVWWFIGGLFAFAMSDMARRAMWIALWTGRTSYAALHSTRTYGFVTLYMLFLFGRMLLQGFPTGSLGELIFVVLMLGSLVFYLPSRKRMESKLTNELRLIAAAPLAHPKDPRFRDWNPDRIGVGQP
jgi:hypothetical protein